MVKKSALTPVLSVVLAILILASGVLVAFRSNLFSKKKEKANETNYKVEFQGLNDVMTYLSNSATRLGDTFNGKVDAGYTTELGIELSDDVIYELGLKTNPGKVCITADSKLKGELAASNIGFKLNDGTILSVNTVIDGETVYLQIPELSKKYIKMDASELSNLTSELESLEDVTGVNTEELETLLNSFDEEKINKIIEKYTKIIEDNIPEGKKNGSEKGDINGIIYDYTKKEYTITSEVAYNMLKDILTEVGKDKDIKELYDYYIESAKKEMEEYNYDRYELDDYYPSFDDMIAETLEDLEDDYENINDDDEYLVKINVFYDGEKATGFSIVEDDQTITFVMS
ncbi:MAG: hypothetical protein GX896_03255, partial [Clostridiales bacterium]|nr:hypothetical protein [Clostridiales bacterium]